MRPAPIREAMIHSYLNGMSMREVAEAFGWTPGAVQTALNRWGVKLPPEERARRVANAVRRTPKENWGWPTVWPDCPDDLRADYETLRKYYPAREARAMLEGV